jgi:hypothetical protein
MVPPYPKMSLTSTTFSNLSVRLDAECDVVQSCRAAGAMVNHQDVVRKIEGDAAATKWRFLVMRNRVN